MSDEIRAVVPATLPPPAGHYAPVVVHGGLAYVSGQLPVSREGRLPPDAPFEQQARLVIANVRAALEAAGSSLDRVVRCTVYVSDVADWPVFNRVYAEAFGDHKPARTVVPVGPLHYGYRVEMEAIGVVARESGAHG